MVTPKADDRTTISAGDRTLCDKVQGLLDTSVVDDDKKEELLQAMLGLARGITNEKHNGDVLDLQEDFEKAFLGLTAEQVDMLLSYRKGNPPMIVGHPEEDTAQLTLDHTVGKGDFIAVAPRIFKKRQSG